MGCDLAQGFLLARPVTAQAMDDVLTEQGQASSVSLPSPAADAGRTRPDRPLPGPRTGSASDQDDHHEAEDNGAHDHRAQHDEPGRDRRDGAAAASTDAEQKVEPALGAIGGAKKSQHGVLRRPPTLHDLQVPASVAFRSEPLRHRTEVVA